MNQKVISSLIYTTSIRYVISILKVYKTLIGDNMGSHLPNGVPQQLIPGSPAPIFWIGIPPRDYYIILGRFFYPEHLFMCRL